MSLRTSRPGSTAGFALGGATRVNGSFGVDPADSSLSSCLTTVRLPVVGPDDAEGLGRRARHAKVGGVRVDAYTLTTGRLVGTVAALVALAGVVAGGLALARSRRTA